MHRNLLTSLDSPEIQLTLSVKIVFLVKRVISMKLEIFRKDFAISITYNYDFRNYEFHSR